MKKPFQSRLHAPHQSRDRQLALGEHSGRSVVRGIVFAAIVSLGLSLPLGAQIRSDIAPTELIVETLSQAEVFLDDVRLGVTPSSGLLPVQGPKPGPHTLRVTLPVHHTFTQKIVIVAGKTTRVRAELAEYTGDLEILTIPNAEVLIDGRSAGNADGTGRLLIRGLNTQNHTVRVGRAGYNSEERKITPADGLVSSVTIGLKAVVANDEIAAGIPPQYVVQRRLITQDSTQNRVFFTADSSTLVSVEHEAKYHITQWDPASGRQMNTTEMDAPYGLNAVSPDLRWAAIRYVDDDERTELVETSTGRVVRRWPGYPATFTPDSKQLITYVGHDGQALFWNIETGKAGQTWHDVESMVLSPDGRQAATSGKSVVIRDTQTGQIIRTLPARECCRGSSLSPNGRWLAMPIFDTVELWDITTGRLARSLKGSVSGVDFSSTVFTPDSRYLISLDERSLRLWDTATGLQTYARPFEGYVGEIALSPDGRWLAFAGAQLTLWRRSGD